MEKGTYSGDKREIRKVSVQGDTGNGARYPVHKFCQQNDLSMCLDF